MDDAAVVPTNGSGAFSRVTAALLSMPASLSWNGEHNRVASPMEQIAAKPAFCPVVSTDRAALAPGWGGVFVHEHSQVVAVRGTGRT